MIPEMIIVIKKYFYPTSLWLFAALAVTILAIPVPWVFYFSQGSIYLCDIIFALNVAIFMLYIIIKHKWTELADIGIIKAFLPFVVVALFSGFYSWRMPDSNTSLLRVIGYVFRWMEIPVAYLLVSNTVKSEKALKSVTYLCSVAATILSLYVLRDYLYTFFLRIYLNIPDLPSLVEGVKRMGFESGLNPNILGAYLNIIFPITIALFLTTSNKLTKIMLGLFNSVIFIVLVMTFSRSAILALIVGIIAWAIILKKKRKILTFLMIAVTILFFVVLSILPMEHFDTGRFMSGSLADGIRGRIMLYCYALATALNRPFIGVGPGNFFFIGAEKLWEGLDRGILPPAPRPSDIYLLPRDRGPGEQFYNAHNLFLQILAETGFLGFLAFIYFLKVILSNIKTSLMYQKQYETFYILSLGFVITFLVFLSHNLIDVTLFRGIGIQIGINLGLLNTMLRVE